MINLNKIHKKPPMVKKSYANWTFKDYLKKYDPLTVWNKIENKRKMGVKITTDKAVDEFTSRIDMTDELLRLKVENGNPVMAVHKDGRRQWKAPPNISDSIYDAFNLRSRLYELIKQAIYQARDKMRIMQAKREKYKQHSLYKMGFLIAKTDNMCKTYAKFSTRAFRACNSGYQGHLDRYRVLHILTSEERILGLWITIDLLIQVVEENDGRARKLISDPTRNVSEGWIFY